MAKDWIESLTQEIKQKNHDAAEEFAHAQHLAEVIANQGKVFFGDLKLCLEENFNQIRKILQGDPTSAEITLVNTGATQVRMTRSRFPWFDAHITHQDPMIKLEYLKDSGLGAAPEPEQKCLLFNFKCSDDDVVTLEETNSEPPQSYKTAEEVARRITEVLFAA